MTECNEGQGQMQIVDYKGRFIGCDILLFILNTAINNVGIQFS